MASRDDMNIAIKAVVVPHLRRLEFKGSMPHFRRSRAEAMDLLSFQFRSGGGSFVIELARVHLEGFDFHGRHIPASKANVTYCNAMQRYRLGAPLPPERGDHWFDFATNDPDIVARDVCVWLDRPDVWSAINLLEI